MGSEPASSALSVVTDLLGLRPAGSARTTATLGVVGPVENPRFLLPLGSPAATRAACTAYNRLRPLKTRATRAAVAAATAVGLTGRVTSGRYEADREQGSFLALLADLLDEPDLQVAVGVGNHDAVWKPTLQCFAPDGEPLAYVKVGLGPVGRHLVETEREALSAWAEAEDPRLVVPDLLSATEWRGLPIVCTAPMPPDVARLPPGPISPWPVRLLDPPSPDAPLGGARWWTSRRAELSDDPDVAELMEAVESAHGGEELSWARWHGDWVPWNLARSGRGLVAWDWEYSEPGAPVGLDEVHSTYQHERILRGRSVDDSLATAHRHAASAAVADLHLTMLATRCVLLRRLGGVEVSDHAAVLAAARRRARQLSSPAPL